MAKLKVWDGDTWEQIPKPEEIESAVENSTKVAALEEAIDRVDPGVALEPGETPRGTISGVRPARGDKISPLDYDAAADGVTNDYTPIMQAYQRLKDYNFGGKIDFGGRQYRVNQTMEFDADDVISITGGATSSVGNRTGKGAILYFPDDIDGLVFGTRTTPHISNLAVRIPSRWTQAPAGSGNGITIRSWRAHLEQVFVTGFKGHGIYVPSAPLETGINSNLGHMTQVSAYYNGRDGIHFEGNDSNAWTVVSADVVYNGGYGIYNDAMYHQTFVGPHADGNGQGDYFDNSWSAMWLNPYSEMGGDFDIGTGSDRCILITTGPGSPNVNYRSTRTSTKFPFNNRTGVTSDGTARTEIRNRKWTIIGDGELWTNFYQRLPVADVLFEFRPERTAPNSMEMRKNDESFITIGGSGANDRYTTVNTPRLGFYGTTHVGKQSVAGSKEGNAALTSLITALKNLGLIVDNTS